MPTYTMQCVMCDATYETIWRTSTVCSPSCRGKRAASLKPRLSMQEKFLMHFREGSPTHCWLWTGPRNDLGYGMVRALGVTRRAHRVSVEFYRNENIDGLEVRHKCDNPPCVNPNHLETGTHAQNMGDMRARGRNLKWKNGLCKHGHDITLPGSFRATRDGGRSCILCGRRRARDHARRKAAALRTK